MALSNTKNTQKTQNEMSKPKVAQNICKNCPYVCAYNCVQTWHTIQH